MPPYTLVVVDMQPSFKAACNLDVIVNVAKEITIARENNQPILFVEYEGCGSTHESLTNLVKGYKQKSTIMKYYDDGSKEILQAIDRRKFNYDRLRVCGVNIDCCIWSTVVGLIDCTWDMIVEIVKQACNWSEDYKFDWRKYFKHPNVKLV